MRRKIIIHYINDTESTVHSDSFISEDIEGVLRTKEIRVNQLCKCLFFTGFL